MTMLVSHHAALSAFGAWLAAPLVRDKADLALFWLTAVGVDVDHYLWYAAKFRNPSLRDAYRFFRSRYGRRQDAGLHAQTRLLHHPLVLALALALALRRRRLAAVAVALSFHNALDWLNWLALPPAPAAEGLARPNLTAAEPAGGGAVASAARPQAEP